MTLRYLLPLNRITAILLLSLAACCHAAAQDYDAESGEDINEVCAGCHGEFGQGGSDGEYPRLAGMPMEFIARQLRLFRDRERPNMAMIEYVDERQMPDADIRDIATFLARITLKTKLPPVNESDPGFDAYARLLESKQVMQIPRAEGDQAQGGKLYRRECASCHGRLGEGDHEKAVPMLAGQYTDYLWRQVEKYRNRIRIHDPEAPDDQLLIEFSDAELKDIFAYLSILDD
ncbi:MAG TPA: c-type cytochrome [Gammaproteobacteria bacterium]|nr:c-type cytochrome [Gammaproteobacteria bacterium]